MEYEICYLCKLDKRLCGCDNSIIYSNIIWTQEDEDNFVDDFDEMFPHLKTTKEKVNE